MKTKIKRDRRTRNGYDIEKIAKIWKALEEKQDFMYINEISKVTGINNVTVRWYLDHYFKKFTEERRLSETLRVRFVKLNENITLDSMLRALELIKSVKHAD